jgi:hypothetical protein
MSPQTLLVRRCFCLDAKRTAGTGHPSTKLMVPCVAQRKLDA